jgi:hypothetical protein
VTAGSQSNVGGLIGDNGSVVGGSYATGNVSGGSSSEVGGLIGVLNQQGSLSRSFATGSVTGSASRDVGGLVGWNADTPISQTYALGSVNGNGSAHVGGLVGENGGGCSPCSASIDQSYAAGPMSNVGGGQTGGLVGFNYPSGQTYDSGVVTNSYWDTRTTGQTTSGGGTPLTTSKLQSGMLPTGFDPLVWSASKGSYPTLVSNSLLSSLPMITVTATPTGAYSLSGDPTVMEVTARPTNGLTLQQVSSELGYPLGLDWVQKIVSLPDPSPIYECDSAICLTSTHLTSSSVPFNDPPLNGYSDSGDGFNYFVETNYQYPFYYSPATLGDRLTDGQSIETNNSLLLYDSPANNCLPGGSGAGCDGQTASSGAIKFEDYLVGIVPCDTPGVGDCNSNGFSPSDPISFFYDGAVVDSVEWTDSFNGEASCFPAMTSNTTITLTTCGEGGVALSNLEPVDALSGSGGAFALPASVPEPSALTMMLLGFSGLVFLAYFRAGGQLRRVS